MNRSVGQPSPRRKLTTLRGKLGLCVGALMLSLALAEGAVRFTGRFEPPPYPPQCERPELYEAYEPYGYRLHPSQTMQYEYPLHKPRRLTVVSNQFGFRSTHDPLAPTDGPRIVVLGDSFAFGEGVEQAERFTNLLESQQPAWRIENLGMTGFGLDNMLRAFEEVGRHAQPDAIVVCIYTDDLRRVNPHYAGVGFEIPRFTLRDGQLTTVPYPRHQIWDQLHTVQLARRLYRKLTRADEQLNTALLERLLELARQQGARLGLAFLPAEKDLPVDVARRGWLSQFARDHDCPYVDLTDAIQREGKQVFIERNWHYNPRGHQITADVLQDFIAHQLLNETIPATD